MVTVSTKYLFTLKLRKMKTQSLVLTSHVAGAQWPHLASGSSHGLSRRCPSLQEVLWHRAGLENGEWGGSLVCRPYLRQGTAVTW